VKIRSVVRWLLGILLSIAISLGLMVAKFVFDRSKAMQEVADEVARLDESDPGWTFEAIDAKRKKFEPAMNGALCVIEIEKVLPKDWPMWRHKEAKFGQPQVFIDSHQLLDETVWQRDPRIRLTDDADKLLRAELARAAKALEQTRDLDKFTEGRFPIEYKVVWPATLVPHLADSRKVATLLQCDALTRSQQGDAEAACVDAFRCARVARYYGDEYTLIIQLLRVAVMSVAIETAELALSSGEPSTEVLAKLQEIFQAEDRELPELFLNAARAERALSHRMLQAVCDGQVKLDDLGRGLWHPENFLDEVSMHFGATPMRNQHAAFLREMTWAIERSKQADSALEPVPPATKWYEGHAAAVAKVRGAKVRTQAFLRCAFIALAAERYRQDNGKWPAAMPQLVPRYLNEVPPDPYDKNKEPLKLAKKEDGVVIYSVGIDGVDDGGAFDWHNRFHEGSDLGFRLWDKAHRKLQPEPD
jgi:hypothetical protein